MERVRISDEMRRNESSWPRLKILESGHTGLKNIADFITIDNNGLYSNFIVIFLNYFI